MNTTARSSVGSTQKPVLAAPPHANSPSLATSRFAAASISTENPSPKPMPVICASAKVSASHTGRFLKPLLESGRS